MARILIDEEFVEQMTRVNLRLLRLVVCVERRRRFVYLLGRAWGRAIHDLHGDELGFDFATELVAGILSRWTSVS